MTGYRVLRKGDRGSEWFVSVTGRNIRTIQVEPGSEQKLSVSDSIRLRLGHVASAGALSVSASLRGEGAGGLSIYKNGKRIPLKYRVMDADGRELARADMAYG